MILCRSIAEARAWREAQRQQGRRCALVPTMGALHRGHLAHVAVARDRADAVMMSVFVNPTQFGPHEDLARYPRDLDRDARLAEGAGVDMVFAPSADDMYPVPPTVWVDVDGLSTVLEGARRPGHFRGVATVVSKLLIALTPEVATFGQKDAQQVLLVRHLVKELLLPTEILCVPTVRDPDGLALSSRNVYLRPEERQVAPVLHLSLLEAVAAIEAGQRSGAALEALMFNRLRRGPGVEPDYAAVARDGDLHPLDMLTGKVLLLVAARLGATRLLDNACVEIRGGAVAPALP